MIGELVALASTIQSEKNHHQAAGLFVYKHWLATPTIIFCPSTPHPKHTCQAHTQICLVSHIYSASPF